MRPIDADETIEKLDCLFKETNVKSLDFMAIGYNHAVADSIAVVKGQPIANVAERKRGKWVNDGKGFYKCTSCGEPWTYWWAVIVQPSSMHKEMPFCPHCGAEMRGEE